MGAEQKAHWDEGTAECPNSELRYCADEISQSQFVGWPFIAEHTGTVEAIFAALATGEATGAEVGIFANRKYKYAEIEYRGEEEDGAKETWTPAMFKKYEAEIPPEDPGALLGASGKVGESKIVNNGWTEFKLQTPVKVVKGEKYWLTNTAFQEDYGHGAQEFHKYQLFYHEQVSSPDHQPWGNYTNEPKNWEQVARTLKELPDPEETRIDCEKCNTEGWLQEEPKGFDLLNTNRGAQEEGGQTYSYASGTIEEGAPAVQAAPATEVTETRATLEATVNPNGAELSDCNFEYGPTSSYGSIAPCTPQHASGETPTTVTATIRKLLPNTTYHFRTTATNSNGTTSGTDETLKTLPTAPTVQTQPAGEVTQTGATLNATVNPDGGEISDCTLEYGTTTSYGSSAPCTPQPGSGETPVSVTATITGLDPNTTYHYRVAATNTSGTTAGSDETLKTLPTAPTVQTQPAGEVTQTGATLNATVNPDGGEISDCNFEYGPTASYGSSAPCSPQPGSGETPVSVTATITGLDPNTTYHYRISASNAGGASPGSDLTLKTLPTAPTVATGSATEIDQTGATLNATVNPDGGEISDCTLEYGTTTSYGSSAPCTPQPGSGETPVSVTATITGLDPNTTYHYRVAATNTSGTTAGSDETLKTLPTAPTVHTEAAGEVTQTGATLNATVNPDGGEIGDCSFEYGATASYGSSAPCTPQPGSGETPVSVTATITGLDPNTTYHYRVAATNTSGTTAGSDETLKTLPTAPTVQTGAAGEVTQTGATLNATVNPNGGALSNCSFEYGATASYGSSAPCTPNPAAAKPPSPSPPPSRASTPTPPTTTASPPPTPAAPPPAVTKPSKHSQRPPPSRPAPPAR